MWNSASRLLAESDARGGSMSAFIDEYRRSLKMPAAEEVFDLLFYRPLAFVFVKAVYKTPLTPNQVTICSGVMGVAAGYEFSIGVPGALVAGAILYAVANILDCADGMLARLQHSGTPLGRIIDGVADYISSVAIFIGIGLGLQIGGGSAWPIVIAAGLSSALHAVMFDSRQGEFMAAMRGERNFGAAEIEKFSKERDQLTAQRRGGLRALFLTLYLAYLKVQSGTGKNASASPAVKNAMLIRLWSFLGPTTNRTALIVCALFGRIDLFLWIVVVFGNGWMIGCLIADRFTPQATAR
jgi:phosphatidylglycerophosphate synthase